MLLNDHGLLMHLMIPIVLGLNRVIIEVMNGDSLDLLSLLVLFRFVKMLIITLGPSEAAPEYY